MVTFDAFSEIFCRVKGEPEFEIFFKDTNTTYMIIKYDDRVSFQRCGYSGGSGEIYYNDLADLYRSKLIDGICLERDWDKVENIVVDSLYSLSSPSDMEEMKELYRNE